LAGRYTCRHFADATQLNSTSTVGNAMQLTQLNSVQPIGAKQVSRVFVNLLLSRVTVSVLSTVELRELCYLILPDASRGIAYE